MNRVAEPVAVRQHLPGVGGSDLLGVLGDKMCTATFDEFYQCWLHIIVIVRNIQHDNALPGEVFPKPPGQLVPVALLHDENQIGPLNLLGRQRNHGIMI